MDEKENFKKEMEEINKDLSQKTIQELYDMIKLSAETFTQSTQTTIFISEDEAVIYANALEIMYPDIAFFKIIKCYSGKLINFLRSPYFYIIEPCASAVAEDTKVDKKTKQFVLADAKILMAVIEYMKKVKEEKEKNSIKVMQ